MHIEVSLSTIPSYLADSKVLEGWEDNDEIVLVCQSVLKPDATVAHDEDLFHLLTTLRYWIVDTIPDSVTSYVLSQPGNRCQEVLEEFALYLVCAKDLLLLTNLREADRWNTALQLENLHCVRYLHVNGFSCDVDQSCAIAAQAGSLSCLIYLHQNDFSWNTQTTASAAEGGRLCCLSYLHDNGCVWDESTTIASARYGHVDCLLYALKNGCAYHNNAALYAAAKGHISCLKELLNTQNELSAAWLMRLADVAAAHKQLPCLRYLYTEHHCPLDRWPLVMAAKVGCIECLQYLHRLGCEWDEHATIAAACHGHLNCLRYAIENGCECNEVHVYFYGVNGTDVNNYLTSLGMVDTWDHTDDEADSGEEENKEEEKMTYVVPIVVGSDAYWGLDELIPTPEK